MSSLDQQGPPVAVAFFAEVQLRLTLAGVSTSWAYAHVATQVPAPPESVRVIRCQHERERDQCSYTLDLFQPVHFRLGYDLYSRISG